MGQDVIRSYVYSNGPPHRFELLLQFIPIILLYVGSLFVASALLKWLWNITIPKLFKLPEITYWEAFRLLLIAGLLFGGGFSFNMS